MTFNMTRLTSHLLRSVAVVAIAGTLACGTTQSFAQGGSSSGGSGGASGSSGTGSSGQGGSDVLRGRDSTPGQSGTPSTTSPGRRGESTTPSQGQERTQSHDSQHDRGMQHNGDRSGAADDRGSGRADRDDGKQDRRAQDRDQDRDRSQDRDRDRQRTQGQDQGQQDRGSGDRNRQSTQSRDQDRGGASRQGAAELQGEQRTQVRDVISREGQRVNRSQVNVNLSVGTRLPPRVNLRPLPQSVISIVPQYRGYDYVYVEDEIVIVEPRTRRVVYVIDSNDTTGSMSSSRTTIQLSSSDRQTVGRLVRQNPHDAANTDFEVRVGSTLPESVTLHPLPGDIVSDVPELRGYRYVVVQDQVLLIAPNQRQIVEVIQK